jgi:hypothetical protein
MKYPSGQNYFFQLDFFSKMCSKWIQDNTKNKNKISLEQKVVETISMYPAIALEEIVKRIGEPQQEKVIKVLDSYTMKKLHYTDIYDIDEDDSYSENALAQYLDLMHHCIVTIGHTAKGVETYELSLFGIIIAMTLVRYHEMGRIRNLLYQDILLQDYYNKIASNYKHALPLIFGKWHLLKTHLKIWSAYNFDIILGGKQVRSKAMHSSVLAKGNKEFYENMQPISEFSSNQIGRINNMGIEVLENYKRDKNEYQFIDNNDTRKIVEESDDGDNNEKVIAISQKLQEIFILMKYTHPWAFQEDLVREEVSRYTTKKPYLLKSIRTDNNDGSISVIDILTKAFEEEITFLYYLNLFNDFYNPLMLPDAGFDSVIRDSAPLLVNELSTIDASSAQYWYSTSLSPKEKLLSILQNDENIKTNFLSWIEDIVNYQKEATEFMSKSYLEIKERTKMKNGN